MVLAGQQYTAGLVLDPRTHLSPAQRSRWGPGAGWWRQLWAWPAGWWCRRRWRWTRSPWTSWWPAGSSSPPCPAPWRSGSPGSRWGSARRSLWATGGRYAVGPGAGGRRRRCPRWTRPWSSRTLWYLQTLSRQTPQQERDRAGAGARSHVTVWTKQPGLPASSNNHNGGYY